MADEGILKGKRVLIVDDEPDILESLEDLLDTCLIDKAPSFETARKFLDKGSYDVAVFDIMGVRGYDLLDLAGQKGVPALMLTAHALNPDNLIRSVKSGARAYVPKDKITDIAAYLSDILEASAKGTKRSGTWFARLRPFFDRKFGAGWREKDRAFWDEFDRSFVVSREELEKIM